MQRFDGPNYGFVWFPGLSRSGYCDAEAMGKTPRWIPGRLQDLYNLFIVLGLQASALAAS
jgi:hypothetical protein